MTVCSILGLSAIHELNRTSFPFCSPAAECMCDLRLPLGRFCWFSSSTLFKQRDKVVQDSTKLKQERAKPKF